MLPGEVVESSQHVIQHPITVGVEGDRARDGTFKRVSGHSVRKSVTRHSISAIPEEALPMEDGHDIGEQQDGVVKVTDNRVDFALYKAQQL